MVPFHPTYAAAIWAELRVLVEICPPTDLEDLAGVGVDCNNQILTGNYGMILSYGENPFRSLWADREVCVSEGLLSLNDRLDVASCWVEQEDATCRFVLENEIPIGPDRYRAASIFMDLASRTVLRRQDVSNSSIGVLLDAGSASLGRTRLGYVDLTGRSLSSKDCELIS